MSSITRGPWVDQEGTTSGREVVSPASSKSRRVVARCGGPGRDANARLIAAAPEMLAALIEAESYLDWELEGQAECDAEVLCGDGRCQGVGCLVLKLQAARTAIRNAEARSGSGAVEHAEDPPHGWDAPICNPDGSWTQSPTTPPAADDAPPALTDFEVQILREIAGELPVSGWGAAVGAALEALHSGGYITHTLGGGLTDKGRAYLAAVRSDAPAREHPGVGNGELDAGRTNDQNK